MGYVEGVEEDLGDEGVLLLPDPMLERKRHRARLDVALVGFATPAAKDGESRLRYRARIRRREAVECPALGLIYAYRVDFKVRVKGRLGGEKYRRKAKWSAWFSTMDGIVMWRDRHVTKVLHTLANIEE